ncbi:PREDICTED: uncharacterized protein LOC109229834 [Nicotiana attenuata]|uniref:uncharacterized protein LOC109229834 n=1 Tax=Nicotiana attenuata TaxID=49451 RepID=UPI000905C864|nr:PREDICTED: uncharacterized protein LOC109229834 [Nicotiana attenuata]
MNLTMQKSTDTSFYGYRMLNMFILSHFLTIRRWEPKFKAFSTQLTYSAIWVRLPELPTEFYDLEILSRVGSKLGRLLKIDTCTSSTTRGRYARICIEVPLEKPLKTHLYLGNHRQSLLYEGLNLLCTYCGRFGHPTTSCSEVVHAPNEQNKKIQHLETNITPDAIPVKENEWKTVTFTKKSIYPPKHPNFDKGKAATMAAPPAAQPFAGQFCNPTSDVLGRVTSARPVTLQRPVMEFNNKFQSLSNVGPSDL